MQQLVNVASLGALYALLALGYALISSVLKLINFAHADIMVLGAYVGLLTAGFNAPLWVQMLLAGVACAVLGAIVERMGYRPILSRGGEKLMTAAIGISVVLEYTMMLIFSSQPKAYPSGSMTRAVDVWGAKTSVPSLVAVGVCALAMAVLAVILKTTRAGLFMRAVSDDASTSRLVGISPSLVFSLTFALAGLLAGVAGVLYLSLYPITPLVGASLGIKAFVCTSLGGKNSLCGAALGGLLLASLEAAVCVFIGSGWRDIVTFLVMIAVLTFKKEE